MLIFVDKSIVAVYTYHHVMKLECCTNGLYIQKRIVTTASVVADKSLDPAIHSNVLCTPFMPNYI